MSYVQTSALFDLRCKNCKYDLDDGDVYEKLKSIYYFIYNNDYIKHLAQSHGWRENYRLRFTKETEVYSEESKHWICPNCKARDPLCRTSY